MNLREAIASVRFRLQNWENTPTTDNETITAAINEAIRKICIELRPVKACFRNTNVVAQPTGVGDVLQQTVFSVDTSLGSAREAPNKTFLAMCSLFITKDEKTYELTEVQDYWALHSRQDLYNSAQAESTPTSYAVINRAGYEFNVHIWPCPNGIEALGLEGWYYYIPGPLTSLTQRLEISDIYVDLIWPYVLALLSSGSKKDMYRREFYLEMDKARKMRAPEVQHHIAPLQGF